MTEDDSNPLLRPCIDIPFGDVRAEHVEPALERLMREAQAAVDAVAQPDGPRTYDATLGALERATERIEWAMGVVEHLEAVATTSAFRAAYTAMRPRVSAFFSAIPLDEGLWRALRAFAETSEAAALPPTRARMLQKTLADFRRSGAELGADAKAHLAEMDVALSRLTTRFSQNVLDSTHDFQLVIEDEARLAGLPESAKEAARQDAKARDLAGWRFTLQAPSVVAVLTYLDDAAVREKVWRAYDRRATGGAHDNRALIVEILALRRARARLLGYATFADLVLEDRMAEEGAKARRFVDDLRDKTLRAFARERASLHAFRREQGGGDAQMRPWDVGYWAEKQCKALHDFDDERLRPYFPVDAVLRGIFETAERLYGVRVQEREDASVWDPAVRAFRLVSERGRLLGLFYVDLHPRENKRGGAWMTGLITNVPPDPQVGLICANASPPVGDRPALLRHREVETLFHEFGHLLHHLLSEVEVRSLGGTNVAWDFSELPSQIMENWCWQREALDRFARHWKTGEPIRGHLYDALSRRRTYRAGSMQMRQLGLATVDLALHVDWDPAEGADLLAFTRPIFAAHSEAKLPDDHAMVCAFSHLFSSPVGYAAGYYSYKWAEVLEADAFSRFAQAGVFDRSTGTRFRRAILSRGDSADPSRLFRDFMGRDPRSEALLERQGLTDSIDRRES